MFIEALDFEEEDHICEDHWYVVDRGVFFIFQVQ